MGLFVLLSIALAYSAGAQITPSGAVTVGATITYTYNDGNLYNRRNWVVTNGTKSNETFSGTSNSVDVTWSAPCGTGTLTFKNLNTVISTLNVTINPTLATPTGTFTSTQYCRYTTITRNGTPPTGETWYWQTSASGTSTTNSTANYDITASGFYYLRAYACGSWSTNSLSTGHTVVINPAAPSGNNGSRCGTGTVAISATPGSQGDNIRWYNASSGGSALYTGTAYTTSSITTTTTYYAASLHTATNCESLTRLAVTATVYPVPDAAATGQALCSKQSTSISITNPNSVSGTYFEWTYSQTGATGGGSGTGASIVQELTSNSGVAEGSVTYTIAPKTAYCTGSSVNAIVLITSIPKILHSGPNPMIMGTPTQLSTSLSFHSYQWKMDNSNISSATASQYIIPGPAVYSVVVKSSTSSASCTSSDSTFSAAIVNQGTDVNSVITTTVFKEGLTGTSSLYSLVPGEYAQVNTYADGFGRIFQTVNQGAGPGPNRDDLVAHIAYGKHGLIDKAYLPFATSGADGRVKRYAIRTSGGSYTSSDQYQFYDQSASSKIPSDDHPYAVSIYALTPDSHVTEQGAPGQAWQPGSGHTVRNTQTVNTTSYPVRYWKSDGTTAGNYTSKTVMVALTTDENGNKVRTFTNMLGQTVLKQVELGETIGGSAVSWLDTYYIYDAYGQLKYQVPPKAVAVLDSDPSLDGDTNLSELIYKYTYDTLGRLVEKKEPGAVVKYMVYDIYDRLVLTQDGNLRDPLNKWAYVKYDQYGRTVYTGLYTNSRSRSSVQKWVNKAYTASSSSYPEANYVEYKQSGADHLHGYSNVSFPKDSIFRLSVAYYDNYDFNATGTDPFAYDASHLTGLPATNDTIVRGMATGSKTRLLSITGDTTVNWIKGAVFYDSYDRVIQTQSNNHLDLNALDKSSVLYNNIRRVEKTKLTHTAQSVTTSITQRNDFDHAGRVVKTYHQINSNSEVLAAQYEYNALGQLVDKKLHNTGGSNFLQSVDYRYNIRGWLQSINNAQLSNDSGTSNDDTGDYFGMELVYNASVTGLSNTAYYNGNISAIKWKGPGASGTANQRSYKYNYDKSDKLKSATFKAYGSAAWDKEVNTLNESMTYDHNGNILKLGRKRNNRSLAGTNIAATVDSLTYGYTTNSNALLTVQDTDTVGWFKNPVSTSSEYAHNNDGSMTRDDNKGISSITYNMLGKPQVVNFTSGIKVEYVYDASGAKLAMKTWEGATLKSNTNYTGGFVYEGSTPVLSYFSSPEGRVVKNGSSYEYQYSISDHQGNTRVVFTSTPASPQSHLADMEATTNSNFSNYTNRVNFNLMDNTDPGSDGTDYSQKLYGNSGSQVGVAKSFKVYPGDKVSIRAYAKYYDPTSTTSNLSGFASALISAFGVSPPGSGEAANAWSALNNYGSVAAGGGGHDNSSGSYPKAYVNLIVVDKKYSFLDGAWDQINGGLQVGSTPTAHDELYQEYVAREEGYMYVFVSNENPTLVEVYFDDVTVTITPGNVIQGNEYYPYGLQTETSWTRENAWANNFLYNGGTELNKTTQVYDLYYRNYDPVLGRFGQVDPMAGSFGSFSPYSFAFNDPIALNDPLGDCPTCGCMVCDAPVLSSYVASGSNLNNRVYRGGDPLGTMWGALKYAEHLERQTLQKDQERVQNGEMSYEEYIYKHGPVEGTVSFILVDNSHWVSDTSGGGSVSKYTKEQGDPDVQMTEGQVTTIGKRDVWVEDIEIKVISQFERALILVNTLNPVADAADAINGWLNGTDRFGSKTSSDDVAWSAVGAIPYGKFIRAGKLLVNSGRLGHIFRKAAGHVKPLTQASQIRYLNLFSSVASNSLNQVASKDTLLKAGILVYEKAFKGGTVWVHVKGNQIVNAGVRVLGN